MDPGGIVAQPLGAIVADEVSFNRIAVRIDLDGIATTSVLTKEGEHQPADGAPVASSCQDEPVRIASVTAIDANQNNRVIAFVQSVGGSTWLGEAVDENLVGDGWKLRSEIKDLQTGPGNFKLDGITPWRRIGQVDRVTKRTRSGIPRIGHDKDRRRNSLFERLDRAALMKTMGQRHFP